MRPPAADTPCTVASGYGLSGMEKSQAVRSEPLAISTTEPVWSQASTEVLTVVSGARVKVKPPARVSVTCPEPAGTATTTSTTPVTPSGTMTRMSPFASTRALRTGTPPKEICAPAKSPLPERRISVRLSYGAWSGEIAEIFGTVRYR